MAKRVQSFFGSEVVVRGRGFPTLNFPCGCWATVSGGCTTTCDAHSEYLFNFGLREQFGCILAPRRFVGKAGAQNGYRGRTGDKLHFLRVTEVVAVTDVSQCRPDTIGNSFLREQRFAARPGYQAQPVYFSVTSPCSSNGQHTGSVIQGATFTQVNCEKCKPYAAKFAA